MFDFIDKLTDATLLASAIFIGIHVLQALYSSVLYGVELFGSCVQKAKSAGFTPKAILTAIAQFATKSFDVVAPLIVVSYGTAAVVANFAMLAFVPDLTFVDVVSTEALAVAIIWRALVAYKQHVQRKRDDLKPAWKPQKKG